jgi:hypothetical protein
MHLSQRNDNLEDDKHRAYRELDASRRAQSLFSSWWCPVKEVDPTVTNQGKSVNSNHLNVK